MSQGPWVEHKPVPQREQEQLAAEIAGHWHGLGHPNVKVWAEPGENSGGGVAPYVVKSNLVRGLPPRRAG